MNGNSNKTLREEIGEAIKAEQKVAADLAERQRQEEDERCAEMHRAEAGNSDIHN